MLSVIGAALYALLVVTHNVLPDGQADDIVAGQTHPRHQGVRELRSWGPSLPALVISQRPSPRHPQASERTAGPSYKLAAPDDKMAALETRPEPEPLEWAKVILAARVHSEASVSSSVVRFYRPGIELQVVRRKDGWVQLSDPVTQESGWVFEKYLASIDGPSPTQAATESTAEPLPVPAVLPKSKKPSRSASRGSDDVVIAKSNLRRDRWARRADRRHGFGLFGRFAAR